MFLDALDDLEYLRHEWRIGFGIPTLSALDLLRDVLRHFAHRLPYKGRQREFSKFVYPADLKALCGAIVHLDYQGTLTVARGLIRHDERDAVAKATRSDDAEGQAAVAAERLLEEKGWVPELMHAQPLQVAMAVEHPMEEMEE